MDSMHRTRDIISALVTETDARLDQQPTLADLSRQSGFSPFHLHRRFTTVRGETPKQHILRVRLERAAYLAAVTDDSITRIALEVGFHSHETFTRAFRRRFHMSPIAYRRAAQLAQRERLQRGTAFVGDGFRLSPVKAVLLPAARLLCSRHTGAYADVRMSPFAEDDQIWNPLLRWAHSEAIAHERTAWAICLDDPTVTPGPHQRLDACLPLLGASVFETAFDIRTFGGGSYAGIEHVGHYDTIIEAYRAVADWIRASKTHTFGAGPPVQIFRHVDRSPDRHRTEVFLPLRRR
jgi:AraC family transcriptional regulator